MDLKVINGGTSKKLKKEDIVERVNVFVQHMRSIEQSMNMVIKMAESLDWGELLNRAKKNHHGIIDTLGYIKKYKKDIIYGIQKENKIPQLVIAVDNTKGEINDKSK